MGIAHEHKPPTDQEFTDFARLIYDRLGIFLPDSKKTLLMNRLWKRVDACGFDNYRDYYCFILSKKGYSELELALDLITTNETYFFREQKHFDYLLHHIVPRAKPADVLRIWSAAASTGEEPYSIAMLLADKCHTQWELLCSDVNHSVIEKAKQGIYPNLRAEQVPLEYKRRFCRRGIGPQEGFLRINPELRCRVNFFTLNLNSDFELDLGKFDLVFLRNVLIYFDNRTKEQVLRRIAQTLKPGGLLFVGHSESLQGLTTHFNLVHPAIYRLST
ncbi:MAG TPA: protein-glutamate O-methyltransferase [Cellvibrionaceae bacterium]|nr:protein-glutamate O-methyltransferase [Cellvibrionaceae bacterium]